MKKQLVISFSGGRSSAYMLWWCWNNLRDKYDIIVVFANTGKEAPETLEFVNECSVNWKIPVVWVEAIPYTESGWGIISKVVTFETASRNGEPFEAMISKIGIPSSSAPFCSYNLKKYAINHYIRKVVGWKKYEIAIGIRVDEIDRINSNYIKERIRYFLIENNINKPYILYWWKGQAFDLRVHKDLGNCDACWKKNIKTLVNITRIKPEAYNWWQDMTDKYGDFVPPNRKSLKTMKPPFNFYRGNKSPKDIFELAYLQDSQLELFANKEKLNSCSESCEVF
jgi:hypothetical protein